ncbi:hypothetical protein MBLNU13_g02227t1 [Cladosporium sp. NU13]
MTIVGMFPRTNVSNAPQGQEQNGSQKRKRGSVSLEDSAIEKKAKLHPGFYDNSNNNNNNNNNKEDDDEELPPRTNRESAEMGMVDQIPTALQAATSNLQQQRPAQRQSQDKITASLATLGIAGKINPANHSMAIVSSGSTDAERWFGLPG